jgi:hypothetical protein
MNQKQDNITTMFETTLAFLDKSQSTWNKIPALVDAVTRAKDGTTQIRSRTGQQQTPIEGVTGEKAQARDDLEEKLLVIADAIAAFAAKSANPDLAAKAEMTKSSIDGLSDSDVVQTAQRVSEAANANVAVLGPYGVTTASIDELNGAIGLYAQKKESPREAIIGRKIETLSLPGAIRAVRSIFRNEIDKLMTAFKRTEPDFYNGYFTARIIIDRAATKPAKAAEPSAPAPSPAPSPAPPK